jgi:hypothetical protein
MPGIPDRTGFIYASEVHNSGYEFRTLNRNPRKTNSTCPKRTKPAKSSCVRSCAHIWTATSPEGYPYVIGEVYGAGKSIAQQSAEILAFEKGKNVQRYGILDSACWDTTGRALCIADQFQQCGVYMVPGAKGPGSRVAGWNMVRHALNYEKDDKGQVIVPPRLQIFSTCTNGIRVIPAQIHDKLKPEDLDTNGEDHWLDALRYKFQGIVKRF